VRVGTTSRAGFTLAEVAVTILIVSIGLVLVLQGLAGAKMAAAETHYRKVARELGQLTLGQVEAGLFWEELHASGDGLAGTYAEDGYEDFQYELVLGEDDFIQDEEQDPRAGGYHDSWEYERERELRARERDDEDDEEEETEKPFEKVRVKVTYPKLGERPNSIVLERWMAWDGVYGTDEEAQETKDGAEQ
jgi:prepilin-type N-terminal cleavage/methylation domain-containing protein